MINSIATSRPALGGAVSADNNALGIIPTTADRPYILGSAVAMIVPTDNKLTPRAIVGNSANVQGIMGLGINQVPPRGYFVKEGYGESWNTLCFRGQFWGALDLKNFVATDFADFQNTKTFSLSVDTNGVFSLSKTLPQGNTAVTNLIACGAYGGIVQEALSETITIGAKTYTFEYPNGIGAVCLILK